MVHITQHAIDRYKQRIEDVSDELVKLALTTPAIEAAAQMGVQCKILRPDGWRVVVKGGAVVTVEPTQSNRPSAAKMKRMARNAKRKRNVGHG